MNRKPSPERRTRLLRKAERSPTQKSTGSSRAFPSSASSQEQHAVDERWKVLHDLEEWVRTPMIILSLVWLVLVITDLVWKQSSIFDVFGTAIWIVFILEFVLRFVLAPAKLPFITSNWLTVISLVLPAFRMLTAFRALRFLRLLRGVRIVRIIGTANRGMNALRVGLGKRGIGYVLATTLAVELLGSAGMMAFEEEANAPGNFQNFGDALWWTAMILTPMGSSYWPVTAEGRLLCLLLSLYAFTVFGYITAGFASYFIGRDRSKVSSTPETTELRALHAEISSIRATLDRLQNTLQSRR